MERAEGIHTFYIDLCSGARSAWLGRKVCLGACRRIRASALSHWMGHGPPGRGGLILVAVGAGLQSGGHSLLSPVVQAGIVGAILLTTVIGPMGLSRVLARPVQKWRNTQGGHPTR